jgi:GT2 family glycosyltransferase
VTPPFVDIILLNYNSGQHTVECLETLMRMSYPAFRVIICDNKSTDESLPNIRRWLNGESAPLDLASIPEPLRALFPSEGVTPVSYVEANAGDDLDPGDARVVILQVGRNGGFAVGNNAGVAFSRRDGRARYLWMLNNDTVVAPDCLDAIVATAERDGETGAIGATLMEYHEPHIVQMASGSTVNEWTGAVQRVHQGRVPRERLDPGSMDFNFVCGCSLFVRREAIDQIGGLDERFFIYAEDADFSLRMSAAGWKLGYAADAFVWHKGSATTVRGTPFNDYHNIRSSLLFVHKRRPGAVPLAIGYWTYRAVAPKVVRRQWPRLAAVRRAFADALREIGASS